MDDKIYLLTKELKESIDSDPRIIRLNEIEKKMANDEEVMKLSYQKDMSNERYNDLLKVYKDDDEIVINARRDLAEKKKILESHPLVREYLLAYKEVRLLFDELNDILFIDFKENER